METKTTNTESAEEKGQTGRILVNFDHFIELLKGLMEKNEASRWPYTYHHDLVREFTAYSRGDIATCINEHESPGFLACAIVGLVRTWDAEKVLKMAAFDTSRITDMDMDVSEVFACIGAFAAEHKKLVLEKLESAKKEQPVE